MQKSSFKRGLQKICLHYTHRRYHFPVRCAFLIEGDASAGSRVGSGCKSEGVVVVLFKLGVGRFKNHKYLPEFIRAWMNPESGSGNVRQNHQMLNNKEEIKY